MLFEQKMSFSVKIDTKESNVKKGFSLFNLLIYKLYLLKTYQFSC